MQEYADTLPIPEQPSLIEELTKLGLDNSELTSMSNTELTNKVVSYFSEKIPHPIEMEGSDLNQALHATKTLRDKSVAHPEAIAWSGLPKPTYSDLKALIEVAKNFVSVIGLPYLSIVYRCDDDDYLLSSDATRSRRCLKRILGELGIEIDASHD